MNCPVCGSRFTDAMSISRHIKGVFDPSHIEWLEAHGFKPAIVILDKGGLKRLAEYIEKP